MQSFAGAICDSRSLTLTLTSPSNISPHRLSDQQVVIVDLMSDYDYAKLYTFYAGMVSD